MITLWSVWVLMPQGSDGDTILAKSTVFRMRCKTEALLSVVIKNPMTLLVKCRGVTLVSWVPFIHLHPFVRPWACWSENIVFRRIIDALLF